MEGPAVSSRGDQPLTTGYWLLTTARSSTDTNGQERRARRFLPYTESMFLPATAVKLRRCQLPLLFFSRSHNGK